MGQVLTGTPFTGYLSLAPGSLGPTAIAIFLEMGQAAVAFPAAVRAYITNIQVSCNDATIRLVTIDTGGTTPTKIENAYVSSTLPPVIESIPAGCCRGIFGTAPRASVPALTASTTVEIVIKGYLSST